MEKKHQYLVLFDGDCPICNLAIRHIIKIDVNKKLQFSPLKSQVSKKILGSKYDAYLQEDSLIFIEDYLKENRKIILRSRAILRIYWIVGRKWKLLGIFSFFSGWAGDLFYRLFAISRYHLKIKSLKQVPPIRILEQLPEDLDW